MILSIVIHKYSLEPAKPFVVFYKTSNFKNLFAFSKFGEIYNDLLFKKILIEIRLEPGKKDSASYFTLSDYFSDPL